VVSEAERRVSRWCTAVVKAYTERMGRIIASVKMENTKDPSMSVRCDALVDTGSAFMVLPKQRWKPLLKKPLKERSADR
jgi:predicted aspartyl protease